MGSILIVSAIAFHELQLTPSTELSCQLSRGFVLLVYPLLPLSYLWRALRLYTTFNWVRRVESKRRNYWDSARSSVSSTATNTSNNNVFRFPSQSSSLNSSPSPSPGPSPSASMRSLPSVASSEDSSYTTGDGTSILERAVRTGRLGVWLALCLVPFVALAAVVQVTGLGITQGQWGCPASSSESYVTPLAFSLSFHLFEAASQLVAVCLVWRVWDDFGLRNELLLVLISSVAVLLLAPLASLLRLLGDNEVPLEADPARFLLWARASLCFGASLAQPVFWSIGDPLG